MTDLADLVSRVRAALDDREQIAREATSGPWTSDTPFANDGVRSALASIGEFQVWVADCRYEEMGPMAITNARHIALHDPAAVLRLVGAMREISGRHRPVDCHCGTDWHIHRCHHCSHEWPCPDFAALAHGLGIDTEETPNEL